MCNLERGHQRSPLQSFRSLFADSLCARFYLLSAVIAGRIHLYNLNLRLLVHLFMRWPYTWPYTTTSLSLVYDCTCTCYKL